MKTWHAIVLSAILTLVFGTLITRWLMGYTTLEPHVAAPKVESGALDTDVYARLLAAHVTNSGFRYDTARQDIQLEQSYAMIAESPKHEAGTDETRFARDINAYNLIVLVGVARNWPIASIDDMASAIEPIKGFGYFQARRYIVYGEKLSISDLDKRIRANPLYDVRVQFAQSCGLTGCARIGAKPVSGANLDADLDAAVRRYVTNPLLVRVDDANKKLEVGEVLLAAQEPFIAFAKERGFANDLPGILRHYGAESTSLINALDANYEIAPLKFSFDIAAAR